MGIPPPFLGMLRLYQGATPPPPPYPGGALRLGISLLLSVPGTFAPPPEGSAGIPSQLRLWPAANINAGLSSAYGASALFYKKLL